MGPVPKTLKMKISLIYIGLVALIALVGFVSVMNLLGLEKSVNGLMTRNYRSISAAQDMLDALQQQDGAVISYISIGGKSAFDNYYAAASKFADAYSAASHNVTEVGEQTVVNAIKQEYANYEKTFSMLEDIKNTQGQGAAFRYYNAAALPAITGVRQNLKKLTAINQNAMFASKNEASGKARVAVSALLVLTLFAVAGGFLVSGYFVNRFLGPLHKLTESISHVRAGKLDLKLDIVSNDETGRLAKEFNEMTKRLSAFEQSTLGTLMNEKDKSLAIVKSISDPLVVLDKNYRIVLINNACEQFFNIREKDALNKHFLEMIHEGELFSLITDGAQSAQEHTEKIMRFQKGEDFYFNALVTPVRGSDSENAGTILLLQNVTELKKLERIKTEFVATVSHEFKTPLTSIVMGASMLGDGSTGSLNEGQAEIVRTIAEDGERLTDFVGELLEISRMESGKSVYTFAPCSIYAIVDNSFRQFTDAAKRGGIHLQNGLPDGLPLVCADFERVTWVLNNLLSNALKYTHAGDSVMVGARVLDETVEFSVKDTGEGIPPEYLDRIFDQFVQVKGRDIEVRGTGLGLSVAKGIITAHGGAITVESKMNEGSTFRFTLPIRREETAL